MFYLLLILHIISGAICLLTGLVAAFKKKRKGVHTFTGEIYHWSYLIVFSTAVAMSIIKWDESAYLFYIAIFSYGLALTGYLAKKMRKRNWLGLHIGGMLGSYIGIVTATLVVNANNIPFISELPTLLIWVLPTIIGIPLIFRIGKRYSPRKIPL
ncbi:DUF2306 domain-containing protein [Litchfieldia alkalitelluris]|uniref:DUF2306 domain-containing protein n=1 Tax=Litchfieldia alkalitelluris TaxID=304268 RepID=UPI000995FB53|nr:DUF2306 domain-containing protein [Litchfieldia alkalitelluris]